MDPTRPASLALLLLLLLSTAASGSSPHPEGRSLFCSESSSLRSRYLSPFFESHKEVTGCVSSELGGGGGSFVHVVRLRQAPRGSLKSVILTITGEKNFFDYRYRYTYTVSRHPGKSPNSSHNNVMLNKLPATKIAPSLLLFLSANEMSSSSLYLLLDSPSPVSWKITFKGSLQGGEYLRTILLPRGSKVSSVNVKHVVREVKEPLGGNTGSDEEVADWVRSRYGGLSTLATASEGANRVSLLLEDGALPAKCAKSAKFSEAVQAYYFSRQSSHGCLHSELAGRQTSDLHIIDLGDDDESGAGGAGEDGANVYLTLSPPRELVLAQKSLERDLILYLRARRRGGVTWYLQSQGLVGNLTVVHDPESEVRNQSLSPKQRLKVRSSKRVTGGYEQLWKEAAASEGLSPIAYVKLDRANIISLVVPERREGEDEGEEGLAEGGRRKGAGRRPYPPLPSKEDFSVLAKSKWCFLQMGRGKSQSHYCDRGN